MRIRTTLLATAVLLVPLAACSDDSSTADESTRDSAGEVVDGGDVGVFALRLGDCIDASAFLDTVSGGESTEVDAFAAIPCDELHSGEVVLLDEEFFADLDEFPTEDELYTMATDACIEALNAYTGTDYATSPFDFAPLIPTQESWDVIDDRGLLCIGVTLNDAQDAPIETSESMKAA